MPRVSRKLQHGVHDAAAAVSIGIASIAGVDALQQRQPGLPVQIEAEHVFEHFESLQHRGGHRPPESVHQELRLGVWCTGYNMRSQAGLSECQCLYRLSMGGATDAASLDKAI